MCGSLRAIWLAIVRAGMVMLSTAAGGYHMCMLMIVAMLMMMMTMMMIMMMMIPAGSQPPGPKTWRPARDSTKWTPLRARLQMPRWCYWYHVR